MPHPNYKLGRTAPLLTPHSVKSALVLASQLNRLGTPPSASADRFTAIKRWGMDGNDQYGDCAEADTCHGRLLRSTAAGKPVNPGISDALSLYSAVTGFVRNDPATDQGTDLGALLAWLQANSFMGAKLLGRANVDPSNLDHCRWTVELYGHCRFGIFLPSSAYDQFAAGQRWEPTAAPIDGRHDVICVNYRDGIFDLISWGGPVEASEAFMARYLEESYAELWDDWSPPFGSTPGGYSHATLISDLASISQ